MRADLAWVDDGLETEGQPLTRRGVLAGSLKLAGAGALALALAGGTAHGRLVLAQDEDDMTTEGEATGDAAADIQVGGEDDADDAAAGAQVEGEADVATEGDDADREARRAARAAEEAVGAGAPVNNVPRTGVGSVIGTSLGSAAGAIGLAAASAAAAILARRDAFRSETADEE